MHRSFVFRQNRRPDSMGGRIAKRRIAINRPRMNRNRLEAQSRESDLDDENAVDNLATFYQLRMPYWLWLRGHTRNKSTMHNRIWSLLRCGSARGSLIIHDR